MISVLVRVCNVKNALHMTVNINNIFIVYILEEIWKEIPSCRFWNEIAADDFDRFDAVFDLESRR